MQWHDAAILDELPVGEPRVVRLGTRHVLLVRTQDGVHATEPLCPHKFTALEEGTVAGGCLVCPTHDAHFDLATGSPRPGDEWAGRLDKYPCRVERRIVQVALPDSP